MMSPVLSLLLILSIATQAHSKLEMVIEVFRHGAREPTKAPFDSPDWAEYQGELTSAGLRQHYLLGKEMRKKYIDKLGFLSQTFNHNEVYVRSTDSNRTIMSVQSHLLGLYPLGVGPKFPDDYPLNVAVPPYQAQYDIQALGFDVLPGNYQPIPVHVVEKSQDFLLTCYDACPNYEDLKKAQKETDEYKSLDEKFQPILQKATKVFNISKALDLSKLGTITSDVYCDIFENNPLPEGLTQELLTNMTLLKSLEVQYVDVGSDDERKLISTPFFSTVQSYFKLKISGDSSLKYVIFSAHDTTLQPFMATLNLTSWNCILDQLEGAAQTKENCVPGYPAFATQILFELYSNQTDVGAVYVVKVIYNGVEMKMCQSENTQCLFDEFNQRLSDYLLSDKDFADACGAAGSELKTPAVAIAFLKQK